MNDEAIKRLEAAGQVLEGPSTASSAAAAIPTDRGAFGSLWDWENPEHRGIIGRIAAEFREAAGRFLISKQFDTIHNLIIFQKRPAAPGASPEERRRLPATRSAALGS